MTMTVVEGIDALEPSLGRLFVVVGVFDGLHLGHRYLLEELVREAAGRQATPAVLTFDHHPDEVITGSAPPLLCDRRERFDRLASAGVGVAIVQHFDQELRQTPYDAFVRRILERVELAGFLMTPESAFGFERRGTPQRVAALGREVGFDVVVVPAFTLEGAPVTSSAVRAAIAAGDLEAAERLLGRPVCLTGVAQPLHEGASALAFELPVALPPPGRYRGRIEDGGKPRDAEVIVTADEVLIEMTGRPLTDLVSVELSGLASR